MPLTKRVQVLFSPEEYKRLKDLSRKKKTTMGSLIRNAVDGTFAGEKESRTKELLRSCGKVKLDIDLDKLREGRDFNR